MPTKFESNRAKGKDLDRINKRYVQNECDFLTKRRRRRIFKGQNVNENKAMTKIVIAITERISQAVTMKS